jgi:ribosome-associated toxin RatA of RatAB toxin-antitoxin module
MIAGSTMIQIKREALVPYSVEQMYELVNDVAKYPLFLQGCKKTQILEQSHEQMVATLWISKGLFTQAFTTRNLLQAPRMISMRLEKGPFEAFFAEWHFHSFGESGCQVTFDAQFTLSHQLLNWWFQSTFENLCQSLVKQFCDRAKHLYAS